MTYAVPASFYAAGFKSGDRVQTPYGVGTFLKWKYGQMNIDVDDFTSCRIDREHVSAALPPVLHPKPFVDDAR